MIQLAVMPLGEKPGDDCLGSCSPAPGPRVWYPSLYLRRLKKSIDLPDEGEAKIKFKVTSRETNTRNGETRHSATIDVMSIETPDKEEKKPAAAVAKKVNLSALRPGMIRLADSRPRDGNGQYVANETGGADPNSMAAAYGGVVAEKQKRIGLLTRLRRTLRPGMVPPPVPGV